MSSLLNSIVRGFGSQIGRTAASETIGYARNSGGGLKHLFYGALIGLVIMIGFCYVVIKLDGGKASARIETQMKADSLTNANSNVEYYKGHVVFTGPRGGKYYLTKSGRKHYL
jgi:hypothetical protein